MSTADTTPLPNRGTVREVALAFLWLGLTSFGGPIAHIGYFRRAFVERRRWLDEHEFAGVLALCQFLPGPASSQLGFAIGLIRAGWLGAIAAFVGFTAPSAVLMVLIARASTYLTGPWGQAVVHGLKLAAVAVVAQALLAMSRTLLPDWPRRTMALLALILMVISTFAPMQWLLVVLGAIAGLWVCKSVGTLPAMRLSLRYGRTLGGVFLGIFAALLLAVFAAANWSASAQVAAAFYRAGALVFGGGHVVLPMLEPLIVRPGWLDAPTFLAGYGAAQAMPGPLFSVAAYFGEQLPGELGGTVGALIAVLAIFLPGLLLVTGALPFWSRIGANAQAARAVAGVNAVVVGLLAAAFYNPVCANALTDLYDGAIALAAIGLLLRARCPPLLMVAGCVALSVLKTCFSLNV